MLKKWALLFAVAILFLVPLSGYAEENKKDTLNEKDGYTAEEKINTAGVFFVIVSAEYRLFEMEVDIRYQRYGSHSKRFNLSVDEAGDHVFDTVLIAYRTAAEGIPFSELVTKKGQKLLNKKAWEEIGRSNDFFRKTARVIGVNVKNITPDPDPESEGRPTMFFLHEESGDAKAGI